MLANNVNLRPERSKEERRRPAAKALTVTNSIKKQKRQSQAA